MPDLLKLSAELSVTLDLSAEIGQLRSAVDENRLGACARHLEQLIIARLRAVLDALEGL